MSLMILLLLVWVPSRQRRPLAHLSTRRAVQGGRSYVAITGTKVCLRIYDFRVILWQMLIHDVEARVLRRGQRELSSTGVHPQSLGQRSGQSSPSARVLLREADGRMAASLVRQSRGEHI